MFVLIVGILTIRNKLDQIKKIRELEKHDISAIKHIMGYLGRKEGFENNPLEERKQYNEN
jgi:hypothetical protein